MSGLRQPLGLNEYLNHILEAISRIEIHSVANVRGLRQ